MLQISNFIAGPLKTSGVFEQEPGERSIGDGLADIGHEPLEEPNIMHRNEQRAKHLVREKIVTDRSAGKCTASVALATGLNRAFLAGKTAVSEANRARSGEGIGVAAISRGQGAIEHIDACRDGDGDVARESNAHQVARFMNREHGGGFGQDAFHGFKPFTDR